jgi:hypothetical protein
MLVLSFTLFGILGQIHEPMQEESVRKGSVLLVGMRVQGKINL